MIRHALGGTGSAPSHHSFPRDSKGIRAKTAPPLGFSGCLRRVRIPPPPPIFNGRGQAEGRFARADRWSRCSGHWTPRHATERTPREGRDRKPRRSKLRTRRILREDETNAARDAMDLPARRSEKGSTNGTTTNLVSWTSRSGKVLEPCALRSAQAPCRWTTLRTSSMRASSGHHAAGLGSTLSASTLCMRGGSIVRCPPFLGSPTTAFQKMTELGWCRRLCTTRSGSSRQGRAAPRKSSDGFASRDR